MAEITIRKGNVELNVPLDQKDRYLKLGYSVYEGKKLIEEAPTTDVGVLQSKVASLLAENKELKAEITKLKKKASDEKKATK
jgi:cell division protein FtsB